MSIGAIHCENNLKVVYRWNEIDYAYPTPEERQLAIENQTFIPENVIPVGLEVHENRLFVTFPRWKVGVPASLAYVDLNGKCHAIALHSQDDNDILARVLIGRHVGNSTNNTRNDFQVTSSLSHSHQFWSDSSKQHANKTDKIYFS